jgi:glutamate dehydrogenase
MSALRQLDELIAKRFSKRHQSLLRTLVGPLFEKASSELLNELGGDGLLAVASSALSFIQCKQPEEVKVRLFNPLLQADGWEAYTVLELTLKDRPFIIDSVRAELRRQGFELRHSLHPVLRLRRSADGELIALLKGRGVAESYGLFLLTRQDDTAKLARLEEGIKRVLHDVVLATNDYPLMREQTGRLSERLRQLAKGLQGDQRQRAGDLREYATFMDWLDNDHFVFLGYREYDLLELDGVSSLCVAADSGLGILRDTSRSAYARPVPISRLPEGLRERVIGGPLLVVTKTNAEATVHRPIRMDYIGLKRVGDDWQVLGEQRFIGLFTSQALSTPVQEIPILRRKLKQVLELDNAIPGGHDYKQIIAIFNSMPREELFWVEPAQLHHEVRVIMGMEREQGLKLTLRDDPLGRGLAVMVVMPRDRFNSAVRRAIQQHLHHQLQASRADYQLAMGEDEAQVRFHFFFTTNLRLAELDADTLERELAELTRSWDDHLLQELTLAKGERAARVLFERYRGAFDEAYKSDLPADVALRDIDKLEALRDAAHLVDLVDPGYPEVATHIKIYHQERTLVLSEVLPRLENLGLRVLEQISYGVRLDAVPSLRGDGTVRGIDIFRVQDHLGRPLDVRIHKDRLIAALSELLKGEVENDRLNRLVLAGQLNMRQVALLRSYQMYHAQLAVTSRHFINETLLAHPAMARLLVQYFEARFQPDMAERVQREAEFKERFLTSLNDISSLPEDRTLRALLNLIEATTRTNYFQHKPYLSFKIESSLVETMPEPRPYREIVVVGPGVEGIHLRGGKVARGGLRWSDRPDDFRTEVLGLMKTQMTKNAVIVPVGAKGGFVVKRAPEGQGALRAYVEAQYEVFLRGLLDLTDNLVDGRVIAPAGLIKYDDADPYLVVAADKGTATFSDLANRIAAEYNFWLGDAFASGGSNGYDHKKEGITARGAWECVNRHFRELGRDFSEPITVVGIGDMSGDVFGNGLLYRDTLKLVAAFNHQHIFLDPNPDPQASYAERRRLFALPRSSWEDYDRSLLSEGGGIYSRFAKRIPLSPQVKVRLAIDDDALSGQDLIKAVLRTPVDLLWNGGIGTYIKAGNERHSEVGDSSNDSVRIDAGELRAKVVGEGGNLGLTQLARIEYALAGGRINTDAIDNSGGVDLSDHEVNIKILLSPLVQTGELKEVERKALLAAMTNEVSRLVLRDNYSQSLCLSLAQRRSQRDLPLFESLQSYLAERGVLKPQLEFLPNRRSYEERHKAGLGLTRPELAILLAYTKMGLYRRLLETDLPDEPTFQHYLFEYFPELLQQRFPEAIRAHPLRREIIATQFANKVVDLVGITFVHRIIRDTGALPVEVIRAALVAFEMLDVSPFLERIFALDRQVSAEAQYQALEELVKAIEGVVGWLIFNDVVTDPLDTFITCYREPLSRLGHGLQALLPENERQHYQQGFEEALAAGFPESLAHSIASLAYLPSSLGIVDITHTAQADLAVAAHHFFALGERLKLGWLRDNLAAIQHSSKWEKIASGGLIIDLRRAQRDLTTNFVLGAAAGGPATLDAFLAEHPRLLKRYDEGLRDVQENNALSLASGGVLARLLLQLVEETRRTMPAAPAPGDLALSARLE